MLAWSLWFKPLLLLLLLLYSTRVQQHHTLPATDTTTSARQSIVAVPGSTWYLVLLRDWSTPTWNRATSSLYIPVEVLCAYSVPFLHRGFFPRSWVLYTRSVERRGTCSMEDSPENPANRSKKMILKRLQARFYKTNIVLT